MFRKLVVHGLVLLCVAQNASAQRSVFEMSNGKQTATYPEIIDWYKKLDLASPMIQLKEMGTTDAGYPLHLVLVSADGQFDPVRWRAQKKVIILINNGIHPGEPDGIDASMMMVRDVASKKISLPDHIALGIIPVYNIGGCLNRNAYTRANQNGPEAYGFRGNAQNLDLNRDFTKCDSREASSFTEIFHLLDPDILVDTHVSDGADFQHTMTLISTQYDKLGKPAGNWMREVFEPALYKEMKNRSWDMIPYVDFDVTDFEKGMYMFYDPPRYSSGYAALFGTLAFVPETHMLKPFAERVRSTYDLLLSFIGSAANLSEPLLEVRAQWKKDLLNQAVFPLSWIKDSSRFTNIMFKGYQRDSSMSAATGLQRMYYNHDKPFEKPVKYYYGFKPNKQVSKPKAYIIPRGWHEVIRRLQENRVQMQPLVRDTQISVESYLIEDYSSYSRPYEKHRKNHSVKTFTQKKTVGFLSGDLIIYLDQPANRYIIEMLEPTGDDSFFAWNFFDAILQQKEGYSDYRWEELAASVLDKDPALRQKLEKKKKEDPKFAASSSLILDYIYMNSEYREKAYMQYPVYRIPLK